jgi:hypothetical protein
MRLDTRLDGGETAQVAIHLIVSGVGSIRDRALSIDLSALTSHGW